MPHPAPGSPALHRALAAIVGPTHVLTDPALRHGFERDWTGRFGGAALAVVRPGTATEVAAVLDVCARGRVPVVLQGGNTGLVGGGVPRGGEVLVSLRRLAGIGAVDAAARQVTVGPGATLASVQAAVRAAGLDVGVDLGSRDGATIGGMVATDAGGIHALAHGTMGEQVVALAAARTDGSVGPVDAAACRELVRSEGTLAAITEVTLRLVDRPPDVAVALVAVASTAAAVQLVRDVRASVRGLTAAELVLPDGLALTAGHLGVPQPFSPLPAAAVLLEVRAASGALDRLAAALDDAPGVGEVLVATDGPDRRRLWALREAHGEAIATLGVPHKLDVIMPDARVGEFLEQVGPCARAVARDARVIVFGHLGVGDLHVNVIGPDPDDGAVDDAVLGLIHELGGDPVGEHGAGIAKAEWVRQTRSPAELRAIADRKARWDPQGVLNPGVIPAARPTIEP